MVLHSLPMTLPGLFNSAGSDSRYANANVNNEELFPLTD